MTVNVEHQLGTFCLLASGRIGVFGSAAARKCVSPRVDCPFSKTFLRACEKYKRHRQSTPPQRSGGAAAPALRVRAHPAQSSRATPVKDVLRPSSRAHIGVIGSACSSPEPRATKPPDPRSRVLFSQVDFVLLSWLLFAGTSTCGQVKRNGP
jgi:hypothetical protein